MSSGPPQKQPNSTLLTLAKSNKHLTYDFASVHRLQLHKMCPFRKEDH